MTTLATFIANARAANTTTDGEFVNSQLGYELNNLEYAAANARGVYAAALKACDDAETIAFAEAYLKGDANKVWESLRKAYIAKIAQPHAYNVNLHATRKMWYKGAKHAHQTVVVSYRNGHATDGTPLYGVVANEKWVWTAREDELSAL